MRLFLVIGKNSSKVESNPKAKGGSKAKNSPKVENKPGEWRTLVQPNEDRVATFDKFFELIEADDPGLQELQLIATTEGVERRHFFDPR